MDRRRAVLIWVLSAAAMLAGARGAAASEPWRMVGAGGEAGAWVVTPVTVPRSPNDEAGIRRGQLHYLPASAPMGTILGLRAHALREPPALMTAFGDRVVFIYPGKADAAEGSASGDSPAPKAIPVRSLHLSLAQLPVVFLDPPDRFGVEPPLLTEGQPIEAADTAIGLFVLVRDRDGLSLHMLGRGGWGLSAAPAALDAKSPVRLLSYQRGVALVSRDKSGRAGLWTLASPDGSWTRSSAPAEAVGASLISTSGGVISLGRDLSKGALRLRLLDADRMIELAEVSEVAEDHAVAALGENIAVLWMEDATPPRLRVAVVSSITGRTLYDGYARFPPPLTPSDLRLVALLLMTVMLGVLLFLLKPETAARVAPASGWMLAEPGRRLLAAGVDIAIAGLGSSALWSVPWSDSMNLGALFMFSGADSWPVFTTTGIYLLHGVIGEWLLGRTIGKAALRCRVVSTRGGRLRLWQAITRNLVKGVAPPLVALILFDPNRRHPGDLLGSTIVVTRSTDQTEGPTGEQTDTKGDHEGGPNSPE